MAILLCGPEELDRFLYQIYAQNPLLDGVVSIRNVRSKP
jgi:hypothetical protein